MNPDAKPREERKRAHGGEPPGPEAKKAALPAPEPKAAVIRLFGVAKAADDLASHDVFLHV